MHKFTAIIPFPAESPHQLRLHYEKLLEELSSLDVFSRVLTTAPKNSSSGIIQAGRHFEIVQNLNEPEHLPPGTQASVLSLSSKEVLKDGYVVVINPAAVRLTTASIRTAIRSFKETLPNLLVSCSLFREHPCQYNLYTSVMDAGSVDFTDGCCVNVNLSSPLVRFKRKAISTIEMMFAPYVTDNDLLLQTVPLNSGVPDWNASEQFFIPKGKCRVAWTPVKQYEGCMYTLMKIVKDGWCDCLTPLVSAFLPWKLDSYSDVTRVLRDTGTPIQGRQNFPDLLQPNRVIAVADSVSSLLRTPSELHVRPLVLENSESIVIEDEVDWFQHSAAMEMA